MLRLVESSSARVLTDGSLLIPAGYMHLTEANIAVNDQVLMAMGSSKVAGKNGPGTGFLIKGTAAFITSGPDFDVTRDRFIYQFFSAFQAAQ